MSYEAPALFLIFQAYFQGKDFMVLRSAALASGATDDEWKKFLAYVAGVYGNMSNYHGFGDMKFVPEISMATFKNIIYSNPLYKDQDACYREVIDELYPQVEVEIFNFESPFKQLNFPYKEGVTGYFGRNMTEADLDLVS